MSEEKEIKTRGVSVYSVVSAQAGGISDALLRGIAGSNLERWKDKIGDALMWYDVEIDKMLKTDLEKGAGIIYLKLIDDGKMLIDAWKAGLGLQVGTAFMGLEETYMGYPQLLSMYKLGKLEVAIRPRLERYWLSKYTPNIPNPATAFHMLMEGVLSRAEFNKYCLEGGWGTQWHDKLYDIFDRDPDEYMAFNMYKRGLMTLAEVKRCFRIKGYDAKYDDKLISVLHRRPTFRELTTLADFAPLPDLWVAEVLRANGYTDGDIAYILSAIRLRPLREEVRSVVGRYLWQYQIGRIDRDTLKTNLQKLGLLPKELELQLLWGDLRYVDELLDEKVRILELRYKNGDIATKEDAITELKALGILEEKANLMAEEWYWYYTPP